VTHHSLTTSSLFSYCLTIPTCLVLSYQLALSLSLYFVFRSTDLDPFRYHTRIIEYCPLQDCTHFSFIRSLVILYSRVVTPTGYEPLSTGVSPSDRHSYIISAAIIYLVNVLVVLFGTLSYYSFQNALQ
jgi:hypothetical protein